MAEDMVKPAKETDDGSSIDDFDDDFGTGRVGGAVCGCLGGGGWG